MLAVGADEVVSGDTVFPIGRVASADIGVSDFLFASGAAAERVQLRDEVAARVAAARVAAADVAALVPALVASLIGKALLPATTVLPAALLWPAALLSPSAPPASATRCPKRGGHGAGCPQGVG